jgi:hypothetical protein
MKSLSLDEAMGMFSIGHLNGVGDEWSIVQIMLIRASKTESQNEARFESPFHS